MTNILVLPDIHGRSFWKKIIPLQKDYEHIVLLGDYFDPYPDEGITNQLALENFDDMMLNLDIDKCEFLLGNHDLHYITSVCPTSTRYSRKYAREYSIRLQNLIDNYDATIHTWITVENITYLFTHAGINKPWLDKHQDLWDINRNGLLDENNPKFLQSVCEIGYIRGGRFGTTGGPVWADVTEIQEENPNIPYYQVFGHTQLLTEDIDEYYACLDVRTPFIIDENGIRRID